MKTKTLMFFAWAVASLTALAQTNQPAVEDFKPATTNQRGKEYPQVNSEGRVRARISAPQAQSVQLEVNGIRFPMTKDANGVWTGDSAPMDQGNHYYGLVIGGAQVPDSGSTFIFGSGAWRNDIEIPGFQEKVKVLFISCGSKERPAGIQANHEALDGIGIKNTVYVSPNTAHEWQAWRRSLREFAPLLFQD